MTEISTTGRENKVLKFTLNGKVHKSNKQYITGRELREIGNISEHENIFLAISEPWDDELIEDQDEVNLARPKIEHFFSLECEKLVIIVVNGKKKEWSRRRIRFRDVVELAFGQFIDNPNMCYTVAYEDGPRQNPEGTMIKGEVVFVKQKMIFHVTATDKS